MPYADWEPVIGLEIHAQLKTESKIFSSDSTDFSAGDNENISIVSLGLPGSLPVINRKVIELSIKAGLALNCKINPVSEFSRKNYFYPDLPKGYQISQYDKPICGEGFLEFYVKGEKKKVTIIRAHMEEDAGKLIHQAEYSLVNFNRAGVPLLEIVSAPEIHSPEEAAGYVKVVRQILRYIDVCDGNLEEGSLRCDCNVSVRKRGASELRTRVEIKNINSFRFIEKAIDYEIHRQIDCYESKEEIIQETRLYDSTKNKTYSMRSKEEAADYRYFPDPDLLPVKISSETIKNIRSSLPELPGSKYLRFLLDYNLPKYDAQILTEERDLADYYEEAAQAYFNPKSISNWVMTELLRALNENKLRISDSPISSQQLAELVRLIDKKIISGKMAKTIFNEMWITSSEPSEIINKKGVAQICDEDKLEQFVKEVMSEHVLQLQQYREGKEKVFGFFVGQVMKKTRGQADPVLLNKILKQKLKG